MIPEKEFANLQARAALQGVELRAIRNDLERWSFIVTAGAFTQELPSLEDVAPFLKGLAQVTEGANA